MGMLTDIMCEQIERREGTILERTTPATILPRVPRVEGQPVPGARFKVGDPIAERLEAARKEAAGSGFALTYSEAIA